MALGSNVCNKRFWWGWLSQVRRLGLNSAEMDKTGETAQNVFRVESCAMEALVTVRFIDFNHFKDIFIRKRDYSFKLIYTIINISLL
jgi:hypothetical protein